MDLFNFSEIKSCSFKLAKNDARYMNLLKTENPAGRDS